MIRLRDLPSPNCDARPSSGSIDMLVIHYTGMRSAEAAISRLIDSTAQVSAHYVIDEDGAVTRLVDEDKRAWHAGVAMWRGSTDINARSIGIELVNPGHEFGYRPFADAQMESLEDLARAIVARYAIPARNVVGHSDVAPTRKMDPGELFGWRRLAAAGVGLWPTEDGPSADGFDPSTDFDVAPMLAEVGYDLTNLAAATIAFQRHFAPHRLDGVADPATKRALAALIAALKNGHEG